MLRSIHAGLVTLLLLAIASSTTLLALVGTATSASWLGPKALSTSNGVASNGVASNGVASNGVASNGVASNGVASNGVASNGVASNGVIMDPIKTDKPVVEDATGTGVPAGNYRRILSASSISDAVLPEFIATERIVAVSRWYAETNPQAARVTEKVRISGLQELETIVSLQPDLVIVSNYAGDPSPLERLRERGILVFDLGPMLGQSTLERDLRWLGQLLNQPGRGEQLARQLHRRMAQVASRIPPAARKRAIYLNLMDTQLHGGTLGSSYYDVLTSAGLLDIAAKGRSFAQQGSQAWPRYRVEDVLLMAPEIIVTSRGKGARICSLSGLAALPVCQDKAGIIELDEGTLNDPGPGMLAAAEALHDSVYGAPTLDFEHPELSAEDPP